MVKNLLATSIASAVLAACTVGPDYVRPDLPQLDQFARAESVVDATAAALADYEGSVLRALEETENALVQLGDSQRISAHLQNAATASARASEQARLRLQHGAIDMLEVLDVERARLDADDQLAQSRSRDATAVVALYRAMAGGWPQRLPTALAGC